MSGHAKTKSQAERAVARKLRPHLSPYLGAVRRTDLLIYQLLAPRERHPTNDKAPVACAILLARLGNDIRASALLAARGHVLQSWTVASAALESAYSVGYIGTNEERATRWFEHRDVAKHPWPVFDALGALLEPLGLSAYEQRFFSFYRQLSAANTAIHLFKADMASRQAIGPREFSSTRITHLRPSEQRATAFCGPCMRRVSQCGRT